MAVRRSRKARAARRRQLRVRAADNDLTDAQWLVLLDAWGGCAYCGAVGVALQRDCVLPISRGGRYTVDNVVPACASCNASKCNAEVTGWLRRKKLDEAAFLLRWAQVRAGLPSEPVAVPVES
jgi:5-methylcytosine-specific restriction endonuclease McrA